MGGEDYNVLTVLAMALGGWTVLEDSGRGLGYGAFDTWVGVGGGIVKTAVYCYRLLLGYRIVVHNTLERSWFQNPKFVDIMVYMCSPQGFGIFWLERE